MTTFDRISRDHEQHGEDIIGVNPNYISLCGVQARSDGKFVPWIEMSSGYRIELCEEGLCGDAITKLEGYLTSIGHELGPA